ncbi:MAG: transglutaminase domain-containing protein [Armatimonadota bacterium]|nr:MAG: transglutaminase domain-containing protein [Armatimonadota bacterium]
MSSLRASEQLASRDEVALYAATAVATGAALLAAGGGSGSARVGLIGAALGCGGVFSSWHTRHWGWARRLALGLVTAGAAAGALQGLIGWEMEVEASGIYRALGDVGMTMALHMAVLAAALSFMLVVREMLPFSLVPGLAIFGLVGGRGSGAVVIGCFVVFLPAALAAVGQAMLLSGAPAQSGPGYPQWQIRGWRRRHWMTVGILTTGIMLLAYVLFIPVVAYATQYSWPLGLMLGGGGFGGLRGMGRPSETARSYPVGRGPVMLADTPAFSVEGPAAELWRGEVFDVYTGRAWLKGEAAASRPWTAGNVIDLTGLVALDRKARVVTHRITAEQDLPLVIHSAGQIRRVTLGAGIPKQSSEGFKVDKYGCLMSPGSVLRRGASYEVVSEPLTIGRGSRPDSVQGSRRMTGQLDEAYLRVPLSSRRVADLARRVVRDADAPIDKLGALVTYLQQSCVYTLDAPAVPRGEDTADYFLFRQKRGYCDMFATALATMARAVGIPARLALGYAGGTYDSERNRYVIRESDAHAWVEAYVAPWGWVSVDATPAGEVPPIPPFQRALLRLRFFMQDYPVGAGALATGALAVLLVAMFAVRRAGRQSLRGRARRDARAAVLWAYDQLCWLLGRRGRPRRPSETALEFLAFLESPAAASPRGRSRELPAESLPPVRGLTEIFMRVRYGPGPVTEETADLALRRLAEVRRALRRGVSRQPG